MISISVDREAVGRTNVNKFAGDCVGQMNVNKSASGSFRGVVYVRRDYSTTLFDKMNVFVILLAAFLSDFYR